MEQIEVAGTRIAFEQRGSGDPLLLLHGLPGDSRIWEPQLTALANEFTVIAWDAPGCGRSDDPTPPFGTMDVARSLVGFTEALGIKQPHVLGLSWGGGVALALYAVKPSLPRSLVLADTYAGWAGSLPADVVAQRLNAYVMAANTPPEEAVPRITEGLFSSGAEPQGIRTALEVAAAYHPKMLAMFAQSFAETDLRAVLPSIAVPTLVLHGDADTRSPISVGKALHEAIPGSELVVMERVGHLSSIEAPQLFNKQVRHFLQSVAA